MWDVHAIEPVQRDVVAALEGGTATGEPLRRIDTHMSHLFLGAEEVLKLKRARTFPFADLADLDARSAACAAELAVNRALAPELYEAVVAVRRDGQRRVRLDGEGVIVDWLVRMRRFADGALFSELAEAGRLDPELAAEAAEAVARFHGRQTPRLDAGHAADYVRIVQGLRATEVRAAEEMNLSSASEPLYAALEHEVARQAPTIEARRRRGCVVRGHGELHLANICVFAGKATPFDALEFDPALATADRLYDIGFLLADLKTRGLEAQAEAARVRYFDVLGETEDGLRLLPLFMALRAAVRTAVAVAAGDLAQAARYRRAAVALLDA